MANDFLGHIAAMILLEQLQIGYRHQVVAPVINGSFISGSMTAVVGDNGCGKSTLLKTLSGLLPPVSGRLRWQENKRPRIAWLLQINELDRQFPLRVQDVVSMGCWPGYSLFASLRQQYPSVYQALERVGMDHMRLEPIETLSGGQFQRMLFARLLVQQAGLVLLDEPFTGVDEETCALLMELIQDMSEQGKTVIAVLHDQSRVMRHFPQILRISRQAIEWGDTRQFLVPVQAVPCHKVAC